MSAQIESHLNHLRRVISSEVLVNGKDRYIEAGGHQSIPWLFDFRRVTLQPNTLEAFVAIFFARFGHKHPFQVGGLETAAIPLVTAIVSRSIDYGRPVNGFFIRKSRKKTGLLNILEGTLTDEPIILIDDLMNSGSSFMRQVEVIETIARETNRTLPIKSIFSILQFNPTEQYSYFSEKGIAVETIFELSEFAHLINHQPTSKKAPPQNHFATIWSWHGAAPSLEQVTPKSAVVTVGQRAFFATDTGAVVSLSLSDGSVCWSHRLPKITTARHPLPTPLYQNETLFIPSHDGNIYALDSKTGDRRWVNLDFDWCNTPLTGDSKGRVFGTVTRGFFKPQSYLIALNAKTGETLWSTKITGVHTGSSTYLKGPHLILAGSHDGTLSACNAKTGAILWQQQIGVSSIRPVLYYPKRNRVIVAGLARSAETDMAPVSILDANTGRLLCTYDQVQFGSTGTPACFGTTGFVAGLDKTVHAFDLETGEPRWKTVLPARIFASPIITTARSQAALYVGANDATLYELQPDTGAITSMSLFTERIVNEVTYDKGANLLLVPTYANEIHALRAKKSQ